MTIVLMYHNKLDQYTEVVHHMYQSFLTCTEIGLVLYECTEVVHPMCCCCVSSATLA